MLRPSVPIVLADGKTRHLRFDLNAICALEDAWGGSLDQIVKRLKNTKGVRLSDIRTLLWAALLHEKPGLKPEDVGALLDLEALGNLTKALMAAFETAFPAEGGGQKNAPGPKPDPTEPQN